MNYRDRLDDIYSELLDEFQDDAFRQNALDLIDELQNVIEDLN